MTDPLPRFVDAPPEAVTFDFWDTLVQTDATSARAQRRAALEAVLLEAERPHLLEHLDEALASSVRQYVEHWHANHQFTAEEGAAHLIEVFGELERAEGRDPFDDVLVGRLVEAFARAAAGVPNALTPNIEVALAALDDAGVRIGIVCDVGMTPSDILREYLEAHDVLRHFDHWSFSDEVGVYKPDPAIFRHALDGLGVTEPARTAHLGDLHRTDIAGAVAMGMVAIRYAGINDAGHPTLEGGPEALPGETLPEADHVLFDHAELPALLGLR